MAFWKKKKKEVEEVKEAVGEKKISPEPVKHELPSEISKLEYSEPKGPLPFETPTMGSPIEYKPMPESVKIAPLFIKIDRYREVLENIEKLKTAFSNVQNAFRLKNEMDKLRAETDALLEKSIEKFAQITSKLDKEFVRPQSKETLTKPMKTEKVEGYVSQLRDELTRLETNIKELK